MSKHNRIRSTRHYYCWRCCYWPHLKCSQHRSCWCCWN
nr:MAG TPA: Proprotein convertase subtilisin/kexin type 9, PROTEIN FAB COMPLEX, AUTOCATALYTIC [Caudoviricetes sp.]